MDRLLDYLGRITVPKEIRKQLKIADNEIVSMEVIDDSIIIKKKKIDTSTIDIRRLTKFKYNKEEVSGLKSKYQEGTRVSCISMVSDQHLIPVGMEGTVEEVDDLGSVHIKWDNNLSIAFLPLEGDVLEIKKGKKK